MKTYLFMLFAVLNPLSAHADDEADKKAGKVERPTREEVMAYFKVTKTQDLLKLYVESYKAMLGEQYPELGDDFFGDPDFEKAIKTYEKNLMEKWVEVTRTSLSRVDLKEMMEFMNTDLGKKWIKLSAELDPKFVRVGEVANMELNGMVDKLLEKYIDE